MWWSLSLSRFFVLFALSNLKCRLRACYLVYLFVSVCVFLLVQFLHNVCLSFDIARDDKVLAFFICLSTRLNIVNFLPSSVFLSLLFLFECKRSQMAKNSLLFARAIECFCFFLFVLQFVNSCECVCFFFFFFFIQLASLQLNVNCL